MRLPIILAATMIIGPLQAQSPTTFEVVSIKPNKSGAPSSETDTSPGRISVINGTPLSLLLRAFGVTTFQDPGEFVGSVVSNDSGLGAEYDFTLEWVQDAAAPTPGRRCSLRFANSSDFASCLPRSQRL